MSEILNNNDLHIGKNDILPKADFSTIEITTHFGSQAIFRLSKRSFRTCLAPTKVSSMLMKETHTMIAK